MVHINMKHTLIPERIDFPVHTDDQRDPEAVCKTLPVTVLSFSFSRLLPKSNMK